jgi:serine protease Do
MAGSAGAAGSGIVPFAVAQTPVTPKTQAPAEARTLSRGFTAAAKALRPSVVRIDIEVAERDARAARGERGRGTPDRRGQIPPDLRDFFERFFQEEGGGGPHAPPGPGRGTGSGVVIDGAGNILTNSHVIKGATKVTVTFADGREFPAKVVGTDEQTDIGVVRLEKPPAGLVSARLGDPDRLEVGEWVVAIGSPLGLDQTVTAGIVSGKGKVGRHTRMSGDRVREYIQTDAKINPGNSGGPLVNLEGEVVGINTLINVGAGGAYGYAVPIKQARLVADALIKEGRMKYAYLGVNVGDLRELREELKEKAPPLPEKGAVVRGVVGNAPAARAGVRAGDIITKIDNQPIEEPGDVVSYISSKPIGSRVSLTYLRDGKPGQMQVTLEELPGKEKLQQAQGGEALPQDKVGVGLQSLTPETAQFLGIDPKTKGAVITEVSPGSRAARAGLRAEDVILEVNRKPVASAEEASEAIRLAANGSVFLKIRRGGKASFVTIEK